MRIYFIISFFGFALLMNNGFAQSVKRYELKGKLNGLLDGTRVYFVHESRAQKKVDTVGEALAIKERFFFKGRLPYEGDIYYLVFDDSKYQRPLLKIMIWMENQKVKVSGDIDYLYSPNLSDQINVKGLSAQNDWQDYIRNKKLHVVDSSYTSNWISRNPASLISPWLLYQSEMEVTELRVVFQRLAAKARKSKWGRDLEERIFSEENLEIGAKAPGFSMPNGEGKNFSLKEIVSNGRLTILDFWASYCIPCRQEFPLMKELYKLYKDKGLNILSYSIDVNDSVWKKALQEEQLPWYNARQVSTNDFAGEIYKVNKLPTTYLIDSKGRILAKDIRGDKLFSWILNFFD